MDRTLFYAINHGLQNSLLDWFMPLITEYRNWIPVGLFLFLYFAQSRRSKGLIVLLAAVAAVAVGDFANHRLLKELFARVRPCNALPDVNLLVGCGSSFSFPSSHAVNSFALAGVIAFSDRRLMKLAFSAAALVAFSRVYVGVHYVSDVVVGALVGTGIGYAAFFLAKIEPDGIADQNGIQ